MISCIAAWVLRQSLKKWPHVEYRITRDFAYLVKRNVVREAQNKKTAEVLLPTK